MANCWWLKNYGQLWLLQIWLLCLLWPIFFFFFLLEELGTGCLSCWGICREDISWYLHRWMCREETCVITQQYHKSSLVSPKLCKTLKFPSLCNTQSSSFSPFSPGMSFLVPDTWLPSWHTPFPTIPMLHLCCFFSLRVWSLLPLYLT